MTASPGTLSPYNAELKLIKLAAAHLATRKENPIKNYRLMTQEPLFRGMCYGADQLGITPDVIEREICQELGITPPSKTVVTGWNQGGESPVTANAVSVNYDQLKPHLARFKPDEIVKLPMETRVRVLNSWISYELGSCRKRQQDLDAEYCRTMDLINRRYVEKVKMGDPC
jgi:hypothetical protein